VSNAAEARRFVPNKHFISLGTALTLSSRIAFPEHGIPLVPRRTPTAHVDILPCLNRTVRGEGKAQRSRDNGVRISK
jgi:hypothetical protein